VVYRIFAKESRIIRCNTTSLGDSFLGEQTVNYNFEDETYSNLLVLERKIEELKTNGTITDKEYKIIELIKNCTSPDELEKEMHMAKFNIYKIFSSVCETIANELGGEFTNEGFLLKIKKSKNLSEEQIQRLRGYFKRNSVQRIL
jgi:hypothetical protein